MFPPPSPDLPPALECTLTVEDRVAWQLWHLEHSGGIRRIRRKTWWTQLGALMVFPLVAWAVVPHTPPGVLLVAGLAALVALLFAGMSALVPDRTVDEVRRRLIRRQRPTTPPTPVRLWLDDAGLTVQMAMGSQHRAWQSLLEVQETPEHVFILLSDTRALILPRRADPGRVMAISGRIRAHLHQPRPAPLGVVAHGPAVGEAPPGDGAGEDGAPTAWLPPHGVLPLAAFAEGSSVDTSRPTAGGGYPQASGQGIPVLTFTVGIEDILASTLQHPVALANYRTALERANRRRVWLLVGNTLPPAFLLGLLVLHLGAARSLLGAFIVAGVVALSRLGWAAWAMKHRLPSALEKRARHQLATGGDQRRIWVDPAGITVADAATTWQARWDGVRLADSAARVLVHAPTGVVAIPKSVGQPLAAFLAYARGRATWC